MKKKIVTLMTLMCLIFCCSPAIMASAEESHEGHTVTTYGEYDGHWTEKCTDGHSGCTVTITMYKLSYVCSCGHISYGSQKNVHHSNG